MPQQRRTTADDADQAAPEATTPPAAAAPDARLTHDQAVDAVAVPTGDPADDRLPALDLSGWTDADLAGALRGRGLPADGDRATLAARLEQAVLQPADAPR